MDKYEFRQLAIGDIVRCVDDPSGTYIVTANHGNRMTAVRTIDMTHPEEWEVVRKYRSTPNSDQVRLR